MTSTPISRRTFGRLTGAAALTGAATAGVASSASAASSSFRIASYNTYNKVSDANFRSDVSDVAGRVELLGLQECSDRRDVLAGWLKNHPKWRMHQPAGFFKGEGPNLWRADVFTLKGSGTIFASDTGGIDQRPPAQYMNWVSLEHKASGRRICHLNTHVNSGIESGGHPTNEQRTRDAEDHIRKIRDFVERKAAAGQEVLVTGDFNIAYQADKRVRYAKFPYTVLEGRQQDSPPAMRSSYSRLGVTDLGTHGARHIDYVYAWIRKAEWRKLELESHYVVRGLHSDHRALVARCSIQH